VRNLDDTYERLSAHPDLNCGSPTSIAGVRMLFVYGPDGTPIEFIELPGGATSTVEMWRPITG
jgi:glyoxylase I family protein